jgi:hypothetical protein
MRLLQFENIELRIVTEGNFHAKGYIFKQPDSYSFIIGSSNLTQSALSLNKEWNVKLSSLENGALMQNILREFHYTFDNGTIVNEEWIKQYSAIYSAVRQSQKEIEKQLEEFYMPAIGILNDNRRRNYTMIAIGYVKYIGKEPKIENKVQIGLADINKYRYLAKPEIAEEFKNYIEKGTDDYDLDKLKEPIHDEINRLEGELKKLKSN